LRDVLFDECELVNIDFSYSNLSSTGFKNCELTEVNFHEAIVNDREFLNKEYWKSNNIKGAKEILDVYEFDEKRSIDGVERYNSRYVIVKKAKIDFN